MAVDPFKSKFTDNEGKNEAKDPWDFGGKGQKSRFYASTNVGDYYGTGYRNPVGKFKNSKKSEVPSGVHRMEPINLA
jgi:hypothetical protein